jgi:phosphoribosylamine--glycine ligase
MKALILGGSGREHAIAWKLAQSSHIERVYCSPGNSGIADIADCITTGTDDMQALVDFVKFEWIDLTIAVSEPFIASGVVDLFKKEGCRVLGPSRSAARPGFSRIFTKELLRHHKIQTAGYRVFSSCLQAEEHVRLKGTPLVIKTDTSDGVYIAGSVEEAVSALRLIMKEKAFGDIGKGVIIEDKLHGEEVSLLACTDGKTVLPLTSIKIYSTENDSDDGWRMQSTGALSPSPAFTRETEQELADRIFGAVLKAFQSEGIHIRGMLSAKVIIDKGLPYLISLQCNFSDPETQVVLPRMETDLMDIASAIMDERLSEIRIEWKDAISVCVVVSSENGTGKSAGIPEIKGLEAAKAMENIMIFQNSPSSRPTHKASSGSSILSVNALGSNLSEARDRAYAAVGEMQFKGMHYRSDIGKT